MQGKKRIAGAVLLGVGSVALAQNPATTQSTEPWHAAESVIANAEKSRPDFLYREDRVPAYTLPDVLRSTDGAVIADTLAWEKNRADLLKQFATHVYGQSPVVPAGVKYEVVSEERNAFEGKATYRQVRISIPIPNSAPFTFDASIVIPNERREKYPAFVFINNRPVRSATAPSEEGKEPFFAAELLIQRGYAAVQFFHRHVQPDKADQVADGIIGKLPMNDVPPEQRWGAIAAWAWGASRVMDYLQTVPEIDATRVAIIGHSRGGKTALWAAATDQRFAMAVSNDSGCGGAAIGRRKFGETFAQITKEFPHWFCDGFDKYAGKEEQLPVDQHQLIALIAPRPVYVASADEDLWADPRGEFLSVAHASPVYALYGNPLLGPSEMPPLETPLHHGRLAYHIRRGGHNLLISDWQRFIEFADKQMPAKSK